MQNSTLLVGFSVGFFWSVVKSSTLCRCDELVGYTHERRKDQILQRLSTLESDGDANDHKDPKVIDMVGVTLRTVFKCECYLDRSITIGGICVVDRTPINSVDRSTLMMFVSKGVRSTLFVDSSSAIVIREIEPRLKTVCTPRCDVYLRVLR